MNLPQIADEPPITRIPGTSGDGLTREEFDAVNGLAPIPVEASTGNHSPVIVYEQAVRAVRACLTIDDAKYWNDKSEALTAWARIYSDDRIMREARALKLHAYRRIGQLADAMRIAMPKGKGYRGIRGTTRGARSLLIEHGIKSSRVQHMLTIGRVDRSVFDEATNREKPPSPTQLCDRELRPNPMWAELGNRMSIFLSATKKIHPEDLAETLSDKERKKAKRMISEAQGWLDALNDEIELLSETVADKKGPANGG